MMALSNPGDAYRKVDFEARALGADPRQLVSLCYDQLLSALGSALFAQEHGDNRMKSAALTRALAAMTALQLGVSGDHDVAHALRTVYESARRSILESALRFDARTLGQIRQDFTEIAQALTTSGT